MDSPKRKPAETAADRELRGVIKLGSIGGSNLGLGFFPRIEQTLNRAVHGVQQAVFRLYPGIFERVIPVLRPCRRYSNTATSWRQCSVPQPDHDGDGVRSTVDLTQN